MRILLEDVFWVVLKMSRYWLIDCSLLFVVLLKLSVETRWYNAEVATVPVQRCLSEADLWSMIEGPSKCHRTLDPHYKCNLAVWGHCSFWQLSIFIIEQFSMENIKKICKCFIWYLTLSLCWVDSYLLQCLLDPRQAYPPARDPHLVSTVNTLILNSQKKLFFVLFF